MHNSTRYAKTLFDVSSKSNCIDKIHKELQSIVHLYSKTPTFRLVLITKRLGNPDKVDIISKALTMFNPLVVEFLSIIILNNQINDLLNIISKFNRLAIMLSDIKEVELITAEKLNEDMLNSLASVLENNLKTKPKINLKTDPKIIGGIKIRVGNRVFDNSVSYQIKQLKKTLHNM